MLDANYNDSCVVEHTDFSATDSYALSCLVLVEGLVDPGNCKIGIVVRCISFLILTPWNGTEMAFYVLMCR